MGDCTIRDRLGWCQLLLGETQCACAARLARRTSADRMPAATEHGRWLLLGMTRARSHPAQPSCTTSTAVAHSEHTHLKRKVGQGGATDSAARLSQRLHRHLQAVAGSTEGLMSEDLLRQGGILGVLQREEQAGQCVAGNE